MRRLTPLLLLLACNGPTADDTSDPCVPARPAETIEVLHGPFVQPTVDGLRMRFETREAVEMPVWVGAECPERRVPTSGTVERSFRWPDIDGQLGLDHPDEPGSYTLHDLVFSDVQSGAWVDWSLPYGPGENEVIEGTFRAPPTVGEAFRVAFVGDTMAPAKHDVLPAMAEHSPDVFLHGGDIQYQSFPGDTWKEFFIASEGLMRGGLFAACLGNHEYEGQNEREVMYDRLFDGQGTTEGNSDWNAFDYGEVRFISLNSEEDMGAADNPQIQWLDARLDEVEASNVLTRAVVFFHRPIYSLGHHEPRMGNRAALEAAFEGHDVPLVLTGHNHFYERFVTAERTVITDGGGGAFAYDAEENIDLYPDDEPLRQGVSESYGYTIFDFGADGSITLKRYELDGTVSDEAVISD